MDDEIFIHLQKEIGHQQKELERVESKFDANFAQLRLEIQQMGIDMRKMFKQLMVKMDQKNTAVVESAVEEPEFKVIFSAPVENLEDSREEIKRFIDSEIAEPKSDLVALKQTETDTVEECYKEGAGIIVMDNTVFQTISKHFVARYNVGYVVDFCEKIKGVNSMVFVDMLVVISDPYMFRLLVMGRRCIGFEELKTMVMGLKPSIWKHAVGILINRTMNHLYLVDQSNYFDESIEPLESCCCCILFRLGERIDIGAFRGKDSTVLAYVLSELNRRYNYGLDLFLLSVDEVITWYRDDSLETVKRNEVQYGLPLKIVSYKDLYGWAMVEIVKMIGLKNNCTFCGVFRHQALDRGAALLKIDKVATRHNADDIVESVLLNILRGDIATLRRCTSITTDADGTIPRCKPFKNTYEKEIVIGRTSIAVGPCVKNQPEQKQAKRRGKPPVPKGKFAEAPSFEKEREYFQEVDAFELLEESPSQKNFGTWATGNQTLTDPIPHVSSRLEKWLFSKKLNFSWGTSSTLSKILAPAAQIDLIYGDGLDFSSLRMSEKCNPISSSDVDEDCEDVNATIRKFSLESTSTSLDLDPIDPFSALLEICKQPESSNFLDLFSKYCDPESIAKVGEGTYEKAFRAGNTVCKIVPFDGDFPVNGEVKKKSEELLEEAILSQTLNSLREFGNDIFSACRTFIETIDLKVCQGTYDATLIRAWGKWDEKYGSENDHPKEFPEKQHYVVFVLQHGGKDLENFVLENFDEARSLLVQVTAALAVAEVVYEFEHRDLRWRNILLSRNDCQYEVYP